MLENHWYAADDLAGRLGLGSDVPASSIISLSGGTAKASQRAPGATRSSSPRAWSTPQMCSRCSTAAKASRLR